MSLALAGRFFTTSAAWEALYGYGFSAFFLSAWNPELPGAWLAWHASQIYVFIGNMGVKHYFLILKLVKSVYTCGLRLYIFHYFFFHSKWEKKKKEWKKRKDCVLISFSLPHMSSWQISLILLQEAVRPREHSSHWEVRVTSELKLPFLLGDLRQVGFPAPLASHLHMELEALTSNKCPENHHCAWVAPRLAPCGVRGELGGAGQAPPFRSPVAPRPGRRGLGWGEHSCRSTLFSGSQPHFLSHAPSCASGPSVDSTAHPLPWVSWPLPGRNRGERD